MKRALVLAALVAGVTGVTGATSARDAQAQPRAPLATIVRDQLASWVPAGLGVASVHVPASLGTAPIDPDLVTIEVPRELRAGRPSVKVTIRGRRAVFVPVTIGRVADVAIATHALAAGVVISAADFAIESRAVDGTGAAAEPTAPAIVVGATVTQPIAAGAPIVNHDVALAPPLARGTHVAIEIRRGGVTVKGAGLLEMPARPGTPATARLAQTHTVVHGTLVAPATIVVDGM